MGILPSGLPDSVDNGEELARFLTQSSQFNSQMTKPSAFLPSPKDRETSVSRHGSEPRASLWDIGIAAAGERQLYGAAIFRAGSVRSTGLDVAADEPPLRHAVIRGWPWHDIDPGLQKARQIELAIVIASSAGRPVLR